MKNKELAVRAENELLKEKADIAVDMIKRKLKEIQATKLVLNKLEKQYEEMLEKYLGKGKLMFLKTLC